LFGRGKNSLNDIEGSLAVSLKNDIPINLWKDSERRADFRESEKRFEFSTPPNVVLWVVESVVYEPVFFSVVAESRGRG
jgi:hypothetical protein